MRVEQWARDVRHAGRVLRRNAVFTSVAVFTLAIGLGANAAIFSVVDSVVLRPLPYADPERLFAVEGLNYTGEFVELQRRARTFDVAAYSQRQVTLTGSGEPLRLPAAAVSPNFVPLLGAAPTLGRPIGEGDERGAVVLLSQDLWRGRFGSDPAIVGRRIVVDGTSREVIGVMPADFAFPAPQTQLWIPSAIDLSNRIGLWSTSRTMVGRVRAGSSLADAHAELRALAPQMSALFPWRMPADYGTQAAAVALKEALVTDVRTTLWLLLGASGVVLLIAFVNVSNLLLSRTLSRRKELAIRAAIGAPRSRLLGHILAEGLLLIVLGLLLAVPLAFFGIDLLSAWLPAELPRTARIVLDWRLAAFAVALVGAGALLVALLPAIRASRLNLVVTLADGDRGGRGQRTRWTSNVLVGAQMALAVALVVTATLLVQSLRNLAAIATGFDAAQVSSARVSPPQFRFANAAARRTLYRDVLARAAAVPGVQQVAVTDQLPFTGEVFGSVFMIEGRPSPAQTGEWPMADARATVSDGFFAALGVDVRDGRTFTPDDSETAMRVAVVSETLARRYWPSESAVGRRFSFPGDQAGPLTIVGIVSDMKWERVTDEPKAALYLPFAQGDSGAMRVVVRGAQDSETVFAQVRAIVRSLDADTPVDQPRSMEDLVAASVQQPRSTASLIGAFALAGLLLGAIGIYATISDDVAQRRREIGVRMALGARRSHVVRAVTGGTLLVVVCGAAVGVAAALAVTRVFATVLHGVTTTDVPTYAISVAVLAVTAVLAAWLPARRAAALDPLTALRMD